MRVVYDAEMLYSSFVYLTEGIFYLSTPEDAGSRKIGSCLHDVTSHKTVMFIMASVRT